MDAMAAQSLAMLRQSLERRGVPLVLTTVMTKQSGVRAMLVANNNMLLSYLIVWWCGPERGRRQR